MIFYEVHVDVGRYCYCYFCSDGKLARPSCFLSSVATAGCCCLPCYSLALSFRPPVRCECFCIYSLAMDWNYIFTSNHVSVTRIISLMCSSYQTGVSQGHSTSGKWYSRQNKTRETRTSPKKEKKSSTWVGSNRGHKCFFCFNCRQKLCLANGWVEPHCLPLCLDCFCHARNMTLSECGWVQLALLANLMTLLLSQQECEHFGLIISLFFKCVGKCFTFSRWINK